MLWNAKNGRAAVNGGTMPYVSFGRGKRFLVLLPGLSDGLTSVAGKALLLAPPYRAFFREFTVLMFSRRDPLPPGTSIRDMARDQAASMDALGIRSASVLGVSQGGMIAEWLAIDHPQRVEKLVLAVTAPRVNDTIREALDEWIAPAEAGDHRGLMISTAERSYSPGYLRRMRPLFPVLGLVGRPKDGYRRFLANARAILSFDASEDLGKIACPTLILAGAEDRIVGGEAAHELKRGIPGSELHVYPGLGHAAWEEAPDFNERVRDFITEEK